MTLKNLANRLLSSFLLILTGCDFGTGATLPRGPAVVKVTPNLGPTTGMIQLSILGTNFIAGTGLAVHVGNAACTDVKWISPTEISARLPAQPGRLGKADVTVIGPSGEEAQPLKGGFTYYAGTVEFSGQVAFKAGMRPASMVVGDWDGDGKLDAALANERDTITLLQGGGDGTFQIGQTLATGQQPQGLASGDWNGDGKLDLAVASRREDALQIHLGQPGGKLGGPVAVKVGANPTALVRADWNGDGRADLAVSQDGGVSVLFGKGDGGFVRGADVEVAATPASLTAADVNGDGRPDLLVVVPRIGQVGVFLGNGEGFGAPVYYHVGVQPSSVTTADLNRDTRPDLIVSDAADQKIWVLLAASNGTFLPGNASAVGAAPGAVAVADLNGDDALDLAVANSGGSSVQLLFGNGAGGFPSDSQVGAGRGPVAVALSDLNHDGMNDLVISNLEDHSLGVLLNRSR